MNISYRLKKKEFILLLDLFGDTESLEQNFGNVYIDRNDYDSISESLHKKGFVTVSGSSISADAVMELMMKTIFTAKLAFADTEAESWIYCSEDIAVFVRISTACGPEYYLSAVLDEVDRAQLTEKIQGSNFNIIRGGSGEISGEKLVLFAEEYDYGK